LANILDSLGFGRILAIDIDHTRVKDLNHPRITWITGNAASLEILQKIKNELAPNDKVMIIEDSSHTFENTLSILELYSSLVSVGCYFIVEDGICKEDYIDGPKPGPYEAIHKFLEAHNEFQIDKKSEKFLLTYNPDGYLLKTN
jgi:cephalosporin hydroxylase